ncbi:MAG TPA: right-handed parallel beta-helix repeat-containing protein [Armatimonadota bacterium]|jgi:hypothetical protein
MRYLRSLFISVVQSSPLLLVAALPASAAVVYVDKNASGSVHDGTAWSTAFLTVTAGLDGATNSGDEVWVSQGTYSETDLTPQAGVAMYGGFTGTETQRSQRDWRANETVLDGGGDSVSKVVNCRCLNITLDGFHIRNCGYGVYVYGTTATITNNSVSGIRYRGIVVDLGTASLANNTVNNNRGVGVYVAGTATLTNNAIIGNQDIGVYLTRGTSTLTNNTIASNAGDGVHVPGGTANLINNIVAYNGTFGVIVFGNTVSTFSHNDVYGNTAGDYSAYTPPTGQGNISQDPLFVNRTAGGYRLLAGSPCIDAGDDSVVTLGQLDLDGKPRVIGTHVDLGAYEYGVVGPSSFVLGDVRRALATWSGYFASIGADNTRLDILPGGTIDLLDAVRIARKVSGLEPNP